MEWKLGLNSLNCVKFLIKHLIGKKGFIENVLFYCIQILPAHVLELSTNCLTTSSSKLYGMMVFLAVMLQVLVFFYYKNLNRFKPKLLITNTPIHSDSISRFPFFVVFFCSSDKHDIVASYEYFSQVSCKQDIVALYIYGNATYTCTCYYQTCSMALCVGNKRMSCNVCSVVLWSL